MTVGFAKISVTALALVLTGLVSVKPWTGHAKLGLRRLVTRSDPDGSSSGAVNWHSCGEGYADNIQCAEIAVPLDYRNASDGTTITLAVARLLASDQANRKGAIFLNPGGPGGPGSETAKNGQALAQVVKGQYDLIGFDPRGVGGSQPYVSCFGSALESEAFRVAADDLRLNLPANFTAFGSYLPLDFKRQINVISAYLTTSGKHCIERSGDILPYLGTEFVARDIDVLSCIIEGVDARINYWGFSYGTVIGQYMVKILSPERIGKVIIDGVVNAGTWNLYADHFLDFTVYQDVDKLISTFASSCLEAGSACALTANPSITSVSTLLAKVEALLDNLYVNPVPVLELDVPIIATAADLRALVISSMYQPRRTWVDLANRLSEAFQGNFTEIVNATTPRVHPGTVGQPDPSIFSTNAIQCADAAPYTDAHPPPTDEVLVKTLFKSIAQYSRTYGDGYWATLLCHLWTKTGLETTRSHYNGTLELADDTLDTPVLILSNTLDPITPLSSAIAANERLGNNARLIQQNGGLGHCTTSDPSICTALAIRAYFLDGTLPAGKHTKCEVDNGPFDPDDMAPKATAEGEEAKLQKAWEEFSRLRA